MDDITIGKTTVKDGVFGLIEREVGPIFNNWWMTGIIGFAFNDMAAEGMSSWLYMARKQQVMDSYQLSFYF